MTFDIADKPINHTRNANSVQLAGVDLADLMLSEPIQTVYNCRR